MTTAEVEKILLESAKIDQLALESAGLSVENQRAMIDILNKQTESIRNLMEGVKYLKERVERLESASKNRFN